MDVLFAALVIWDLLLAVIIAVSLLPRIFNLPFIAAVASSGSMEPTLPQGTLVLVRSPANISKGDVVAYLRFNSKMKRTGIWVKYDPAPVLHRIMATTITENVTYYTPKGDANGCADPPITKDRILCKVWLAVPYVELPYLWLKKHDKQNASRLYSTKALAFNKFCFG